VTDAFGASRVPRVSRLAGTPVLALMLALSGCDSGPSNLSSTVDASPTCVPDAGTYTCLGGTWPVCPTSAAPTHPCEGSPACMGCAGGTGFTCTCSDAGAEIADAGEGTWWFCVGTEYTCE
jgi:hypothetical protein